MKILVPMDGSQTALRALDHAIDRLTRIGAGADGGEIRLLNVQLPIPASVGDFVGSDAVRGYYSEESETALRAARERLSRTTVQHTAETRIGAIAETIAEDADAQDCTEIVMGSRGKTALSSMLLGSVASRVLYLAGVPVTIVK